MDFNMSERQKEWLNRVQAFMNTHVRPAVPIYKKQDEEGPRWKVIPILEDLEEEGEGRRPLEHVHAAVLARGR